MKQDAHLRALLELSHAMSSSLEHDRVLETFRARSAGLLDATAAEVSFWDRDRNGVVALLDHLSDQSVRVARDGGTLYSLEDYPVARRVLQLQQPAQVQVSQPDHDDAQRQLLSARGLRSMLMLPLVSQGETIGLLEVVDERDRSWDEDDVALIRALCDVVASAVRNAMLFDRVRELSMRDEVTELGNLRAFEEQIEAAVARSRRSGEPLALLALELDGLGAINRHQGHRAGDAALRAAADALRACIRAGDTACRVGADRFAIILPGATTEAALEVARRAQVGLADLSGGELGFSGGVACAPDTGTTPDELYRRAGFAADRARVAGGGRTEAAA